MVMLYGRAVWVLADFLPAHLPVAPAPRPAAAAAAADGLADLVRSLDDDSTAEYRRPRLASHLYTADYRGLVDVALTTSFTERAGLWDETAPLASISTRLAPLSRLLVVNLTGSPADTDGAQQRILAGDGFRLIATTHLHRTTVYEYSR